MQALPGQSQPPNACQYVYVHHLKCAGRLTRAVFSGSSSSGGGGVRAVLTAQKRHPRVHVSPGFRRHFSLQSSHTGTGSHAEPRHAMAANSKQEGLLQMLKLPCEASAWQAQLSSPTVLRFLVICVASQTEVVPLPYISRYRTCQTGAFRTKQHDGGRASAAVPALADVRALCLLAHRVQAQAAQRAVQVVEALTLRGTLAQPGRLAGARQLRQLRACVYAYAVQAAAKEGSQAVVWQSLVTCCSGKRRSAHSHRGPCNTLPRCTALARPHKLKQLLHGHARPEVYGSLRWRCCYSKGRSQYTS